jgi:hypothetical protein
MTDQELQISVAEARGWKIRDQRGNIVAASSDGKIVYGIPYGKDRERMVPDYPNDMNACLELLDELTINNVNWIIENKIKDGYRFIIIFGDETALCFVSGKITKAICEGYLAYFDEKKAGNI